jgi:hypothetical protein
LPDLGLFLFVVLLGKKLIILMQDMNNDFEEIWPFVSLRHTPLIFQQRKFVGESKKEDFSGRHKGKPETTI